MKNYALFCLLITSFTVKAQNLSVPFEIKNIQAQVSKPVFKGKERNMFGISVDTYAREVNLVEVKRTFLGTAEALQSRVSEAQSDPEVSKIPTARNLFVIGSMNYQDTFAEISVFMTVQRSVSMSGYYTLESTISPRLKHEIPMTAFDKAESVCSLAFNPHISLAASTAKVMLTGDGSRHFNAVSPSQNLASCLQAALSEYAKFKAQDVNPVEGQTIEVAYYTRLGADNGWMLTNFNAQKFIIKPKTNDAVLLEQYGKILAQ